MKKLETELDTTKEMASLAMATVETLKLDNATNKIQVKKSRIRETKHLSTDADRSTDAIGGWTKAKSAKRKLFFCAAILDHFGTKMFKC